MIQEFVSLPTGEKIRLEYGKHYANLHVYYENQFLGAFKDKASLKMGRRFSLPGNETILVILSEKGLAVWHNNTDLITDLSSGAPDHSNSVVDLFTLYGSLMLLVVVGFHIIAYVSNDPEMQPHIVWLWLVAAMVFAVGIIRRYVRSVWFLRGAIALIVLIGLYMLYIQSIVSVLLIPLLQVSKDGIKETNLRKRQIRRIEPDSPLDDGF
jgi:hypothetical protein